jgi:hypothetical protein
MASFNGAADTGGLFAVGQTRNFLSQSPFLLTDIGRRQQMTTTSRGRSQDRAKVAGGQDHEVRYEAKKEGVSKSKVKDAVKKVGNSRSKVENELEK